MPERKNFSVLPAGEWGAAFGGFVVAPLGHHVLFYVPDPEEAKTFRRIHRVQRLPDSVMPDNVKATSDLEEAIEHADVLIEAAKSQSFRRRYKNQVPYLEKRKKQPVRLILSKGLEQGTHLRMSEVILQEDPGSNDFIACLSGPTLAKEIAKGAVAGATVGSDKEETSNFIQSLLNSKNFRVYTSNDITGVELGCLKNIYGLGAGMIHVLDPSRSTKALYFSRALEEMVSLGIFLKAHESTFRGLSSLGDLALACDDSDGGATRNFRAGVKLAQGFSVEEVIGAERTVEGLYAIESAIALANGKVSIPLVKGIDGVAYKGLKIWDGANQLLGRQPVKEQNGDKGIMFKLSVLLRRWRHNTTGVIKSKH